MCLDWRSRWISQEISSISLANSTLPRWCAVDLGPDQTPPGQLASTHVVDLIQYAQ
jgi:hypothetical protein